MRETSLNSHSSSRASYRWSSALVGEERKSTDWGGLPLLQLEGIMMPKRIMVHLRTAESGKSTADLCKVVGLIKELYELAPSPSKFRKIRSLKAERHIATDQQSVSYCWRGSEGSSANS